MYATNTCITTELAVIDTIVIVAVASQDAYMTRKEFAGMFDRTLYEDHCKTTAEGYELESKPMTTCCELL